jgi:hypothetical protein
MVVTSWLISASSSPTTKNADRATSTLINKPHDVSRSSEDRSL